MLNEAKYRAALGDFAQPGVSTEQCIKTLRASHNEYKQRIEAQVDDLSINDRVFLIHHLQQLIDKLTEVR